MRWDGRHFRYADGPFRSGVVVHYKGDLWKAPSNEAKEAEMLNEHDLEDMRPEPAKCFRCGHAAHGGSCVNVAPADESDRSPLGKTFPRGED
ncbi:hypothetical protein D3C81_1952670 [compost metagenome]